MSLPWPQNMILIGQEDENSFYNLKIKIFCRFLRYNFVGHKKISKFVLQREVFPREILRLLK